MTRPTNRVDMDSLLEKYENLNERSEICFRNDVVLQLNTLSSKKFEDTTNYLIQIDHIS